MRSDICARLGFLDIQLDYPELNGRDCDSGRRLSVVDSPVSVWVLHAREDLVAARAARTVL